MINSLTRKAFQSIDRVKEQLPTFIEAHRGIHTSIPENTIAAFEEAIKENMDSIELDIWLTRDTVPVIIHGGSQGELPLSDQPVPIKINNLLFSELPNYPIKGHVIPSLEEVLKLCKGKIFINMEMKELNVRQGFEKVIPLIEAYDMSSQIAMSSFKFGYWREVAAYTKTPLEFGYIGNKYNDMFLKYPRTTWNIHHSSITKAIVDSAHQQNIGVMAWFGASNDKETDDMYFDLMRIGVDVICTNRPIEAKKVRDEYFKLK